MGSKGTHRTLIGWPILDHLGSTSNQVLWPWCYLEASSQEISEQPPGSLCNVTSPIMPDHAPISFYFQEMQDPLDTGLSAG